MAEPQSPKNQAVSRYTAPRINALLPLTFDFYLPNSSIYRNFSFTFVPCWGVGKLVSLQILILTFVGSSPTAPSNLKK